MGEVNSRECVVGEIFARSAPLKINMGPKYEGLVQMIFLFKQVIFRFHVNFPGCMFTLYKSFVSSITVERGRI